MNNLLALENCSDIEHARGKFFNYLYLAYRDYLEELPCYFEKKDDVKALEEVSRFYESGIVLAVAKNHLCNLITEFDISIERKIDLLDYCDALSTEKMRNAKFNQMELDFLYSKNKITQLEAEWEHRNNESALHIIAAKRLIDYFDDYVKYKAFLAEQTLFSC